MQDPPRVRVVLDGQIVGEVDVTEPRWQIYRFKVDKSGDTIPISGVDHRIEVHLVNNPDDAYNNRQLRVDWVRIGR
ncbi:MAG: hypothetical protein NTV58_17635 [Deltaproteobacteria bacterium]|nr:hypothetical protein [Deltaproteobacteria bacterium]